MNYARGGKRIYFKIAFIYFFITGSYLVESDESLFAKFFLITFVSTSFPYVVYSILEWILKGLKNSKFSSL